MSRFEHQDFAPMVEGCHLVNYEARFNLGFGFGGSFGKRDHEY